jgi:general L-amino acid transport system substrate-binding protein
LKRIFIAALAVLLVVPFMVQADFGDTLAAVQGRGALNCGVNGQLPGFSGLDANGNIEGFDADYCELLLLQYWAMAMLLLSCL